MRSASQPRCAHRLRAGEFFARTYAENAAIAQEAGAVRDSGERVETLHGPMPVWRRR